MQQSSQYSQYVRSLTPQSDIYSNVRSLTPQSAVYSNVLSLTPQSSLYSNVKTLTPESSGSTEPAARKPRLQVGVRTGASPQPLPDGASLTVARGSRRPVKRQPIL